LHRHVGYALQSIAINFILLLIFYLLAQLFGIHTTDTVFCFARLLWILNWGSEAKMLQRTLHRVSRGDFITIIMISIH